MTTTPTTILLFGAGGASELLLAHLRKGVTVAAILDNDPDKAGTTLAGIPVYSPAESKALPYDAILICSTHHQAIEDQLTGELGIAPERILNVHKLLYDFRCRARFETVTAAPATQCAVTGISYFMLGINERRMSMPTCNFANAGQDLYYDFKIWQRLIKAVPGLDLKYGLIGLTRYSFHYDLSKRRDTDMAAGHGNFFDDYHHATTTRDKVRRLRSLLDESYEETLYSQQKQLHFAYYERISAGDYTDFYRNHQLEKDKGSISAREHDKQYPETYLENVDLLKELIDMLYQADIQPILFTAPGHSSFIRDIPAGLDKEFLETVASIRQGKALPFWDMLRTTELNDDHFYDDAHLDADGAERFTDLVSDRLEDLAACTDSAKKDVHHA